MKTNISSITIALCFLSLNSFSQTVNDKINKQAKDPATKENAAKADVYIQKNIIADTATLNKNTGLKDEPKKVLIKKKKKKKKLRRHRHRG